jgi:uncharacterized damage-inducible protein DinB
MKEKLQKLQQSIKGVTNFAESIPPGLYTVKPDQIAFSVNEIIYHLLEVEHLWQRRIHQLLHEKNPHFQQINPDELAKMNRYNEQDFQEGIALWEDARKDTVDLISAMSNEELSRKGTHSRYGEMDIHRIVDTIADHDQQHLRQMERTLKQIKN